MLSQADLVGVIVAIRHHAYCAEEAQTVAMPLGLKASYPLTLTFCAEVKHIQFTFSLKLGFTVKWFFISLSICIC